MAFHRFFVWTLTLLQQALSPYYRLLALHQGMFQKFQKSLKGVGFVTSRQDFVLVPLLGFVLYEIHSLNNGAEQRVWHGCVVVVFFIGPCCLSHTHAEGFEHVQFLLLFFPQKSQLPYCPIISCNVKPCCTSHE